MADDHDYSDSSMVALIPTVEDAARLAVDGYEPSDTLHVTLHFMGDDPSWVEANKDKIIEDLSNLAASVPPIEADPFSVSHFNPTEKPCAVYLIGGSDDLVKLHDGVSNLSSVTDQSPDQHEPWVPHLTIGYELDPEMLTEAGKPITFDRLRLAIGPINTDIPLSGTVPEDTSEVTAALSTSDVDVMLYDLDPTDNIEALEALYEDPDSRWYARARLRSLARRGVTAAVKWNPLLHPRGPDGRFIETGGWVRWLFKGIWHLGKVEHINPNTGVIKVRPRKDKTYSGKNALLFEHNDAAKRLYKAPSIRAKIDVPNPEATETTTPVGWQKVAGQGGSRPGGRFRAISGDVPNVEMGDEYYVKQAPTVANAKNELLGNFFYRLAGVNAPEMRSGTEMPTTVASKIIPADEVKTLTSVLDDPEIMSQIRKDFAIDAWLANWGVAGISNDNIKIFDGVPYRLDAGGSLYYRLSGQTKGPAFTDKVSELDTFVDPTLNPNTFAIFGGITDDELMDGVNRLAGISPDQIKEAVDNSPAIPSAMAEKLIARRQYILDKYKVADPWDFDPDTTSPLDSDKNIEVEAPAPPVDVTTEIGPDIPSPATEIPKSPEPQAQATQLLDKPETLLADIKAFFDSNDFSWETATDIATFGPGTQLIRNGRLYDIVAVEEDVDEEQVQFQLEDVATGYRRNEFADSPQVYKATITPLDQKKRATYRKNRLGLEEAFVASFIDSNPFWPDAIIGFPNWEPIAEQDDVPTSPEPVFAKVNNSHLNWQNVANIIKPQGGHGGDDDIDTEEAFTFYFLSDDNQIYKAEGRDNLGSLKVRNVNTGEKSKYYIDSTNDKSHYITGNKTAYDLLAAYDLKVNEANHNNDFPESDEGEVKVDEPDPQIIEELDKKELATTTGTDAEEQVQGTPTAPSLAEIEANSVKDFDKFSKEEWDKAIADAFPEQMATTSILQDAIDGGESWAQMLDYFNEFGLTYGQIKEINNKLVLAKIERGTAPDVEPVPGDEDVPEIDLANEPSGMSYPGVSGKLSAGEPVNFRKTEDPEYSAQRAKSFVGKVIFNSTLPPDDQFGYAYGKLYEDEGEMIFKPGHNDANQGLLFVESFNEDNMTLKVRSVAGKAQIIRVAPDPNYSYKSWASVPDTTFHVANGISGDDFKLYKKPTFKSDGSVVVSGVTVGEWKKDDSTYWSQDFIVEIDPEFSSTGTRIKYTTHYKSAAKDIATQYTVQPQKPVKPKTKSPAAKKVAAAVADPVKKIDLNPGGVYSDGTKAQLGDWVKSTKGGGGFVGKIVGWPDQENFPGLVFAVDNDGIQKAVNLKTQKKVDGPEGGDAPNLPSAYTGIKLADGKTPAIGQRVTAGDPGKSQVKGIITNINTTQGWVYIQTDDGKKVSKTYSVVKVDQEPDLIWDVESALAQAAAATPTPKKSSTPKKSTVPSYVGPDGTLFEQSQEYKDNWVNEHPERTLTKDGYAPQVGMRMRNSKGDEIVVTWVADAWASSPNSVKAFNLNTKKISTLKVNTLQVDHSAEALNFAGDPLPKISKVEVPGLNHDLPTGRGWKVFRTSTKANIHMGGEWRYVDYSVYVMTSPYSDHATVINASHYGSPTYHKVHFYSLLAPNSAYEGMEQVAVIDPDADQKLIVIPMNKKEATNTVAAFASSDTDDPYLAIKDGNYEKQWGDSTPKYTPPESEVISTPEEPDTAPQVSVPPPVYIDPSKLTPLPDMPAPAGEDSGTPNLPQVTGQVGDIDKTPGKIAKAKSILTASMEQIKKRKSKDPGSAATYSLGDSDYIEDMAVRFQITAAPAGGASGEQLTMRFRLRQDKAEDLADSLVQTGAVKKGAWEQATSVYVTDLTEGSKISVSKHWNSNTLAPSNGSTPNATVTGTPTLIGQSNGFDLYRVPIIIADGTTGEVDIERRGTPSVKTYKWNPDKVLSSGYMNAELTAKASAEGWDHKSGLGSSYQKGHLEVDEFGVSKMSPSPTALNSLGQRMWKYDPETGMKIQVQVAHRNQTPKNNSTRHGNLEGEVLIHIPLEEGEDQSSERIKTLISKGMETVGIPVDKQGPPDDAALTQLALMKLVTQFHPTYKYRHDPIEGPNDPRVQQTLEHMTKKLEPQLGRAVTLSDLRIHTWDTGRVQVVISPEVAKAITKTKGIGWYRHGVSDANSVDLYIGSPVNGLMGADERWSLGITTSGQSTTSDLEEGSGDRVYMWAQSGKPGSATGSFVINPLMVHTSTEVYRNEGDGWGKRVDGQHNDYLTSQSTHSEYMYKRKFEIEQIAYYIIYGDTAKQELIEKLKKRGLTHINGRPLEDFIRTQYEMDNINMTEFESIGEDLFEGDVPIDEFLGEVAPAAPAAAPGVAASGETS